MKITSEKVYKIELKHHGIEFQGDEGRLVLRELPHVSTCHFKKSDLEDLMAAFNWLYHETKPKEPK